MNTAREPSGKPVGRPLRLTPDVQQRICTALAVGATYAHAAQYGGVSYDAFNEWLHRGENGDSPEFVEFRQAVKDAEARATVAWLTNIEQAATEGAWQASAWKLERRFPRDYGRFERQEHSGPDGQPIAVSVVDLLTKRDEEK